MFPSRLLPTVVLTALSLSALPATGAEPKSQEFSPTETSLAALRFEEQAAKFRRINAEQIQLLEERILARLHKRAEPSIRAFIKAPPNTGLVSGFVLRNSDWEASMKGTPRFVRIVETQTVMLPAPEFDCWQTQFPQLRTTRVSAPVLSFEEAVQTEDIRRAWTLTRLEIDFELLPKPPISNLFPERLIAGSREEEASAKVHSVFPYSPSLSR